LPITLHNFNSDHAKIAKVVSQSAIFAKVVNRCLTAWLTRKLRISWSSGQNVVDHLQVTNNAKETRFYQATLNI
jgi:type II secretory pathway component PulF